MPTPKSRGRVLRRRTIKSGDKTLICDVMEKPGPRGGRTVCHPKKRRTRKRTNP